MIGSSRAPISCSPAHQLRVHSHALVFEVRARTSWLRAAGEAAAGELLGQVPETDGDDPASLQAAQEELVPLGGRGLFQECQLFLRGPTLGSKLYLGPAIPHTCNLGRRCSHADHGEYVASGHMSTEVMESTTALIVEHEPKRKLSHAAGIGASGEPRTGLHPCFELRKVLPTWGKGLERGLAAILGVLTTNATMTDRPQVREGLRGLLTGRIFMSVDGPADAFDAARVHVDGTGGHAGIAGRLERLGEIRVRPAVSSVLSALSPEVFGIHFHLFRLGMKELYVKLARSSPRTCATYGRFVQRLLELPDERVLRALPPITGTESMDYFAGFLVRVVQRQARARRCSGWVEDVAVDVGGRPYGRSSLAGISEGRVGSVWEGLHESRVGEICERSLVSQPAPCNDCWARLLRGASCLYQPCLTYGDLFLQDPAECSLNKPLIEQAISLRAELQRTRPGVVAALPDEVSGSRRNGAPRVTPFLDLEPDAHEMRSILVRQQPVTQMPIPGAPRRRLADPQDGRTMEVRYSEAEAGSGLDLACCGQEVEGYWARLDRIELHLAVFRGMTQWAHRRLEPRLSELTWDLTTLPGAATLPYAAAPRENRLGRPVPGPAVRACIIDCTTDVPWAAVDLVRAQLASAHEPWLQVRPGDRHGGGLELNQHRGAEKLRPAVGRAEDTSDVL